MKTTSKAIGLLALAAVLLTFMAAPAAAGEPEETWYAFYVAGGKAGYLHFKMTEGEEGGQTVWTTTTEVHFSLARANIPMTIVQKEEIVEDADGAVLRFSSSQDQGMGPQVTTGTVADGKLTVVQMGVKSVVPYPEGAVGPAAARRKWIEVPPEAGTKVELITFLSQAPDRRVTSTTRIGEIEKVDVLGRVVMLRKFTETNTLMPIETKLWVNEEGRVLVVEMDMGMGPFRMLATEKDVALADSEPVELFTTTFVQPNKPIAEPRTLRRAVYRIGNKGGTPGFYEGEGQSILRTADGKIEVEVLAAGPAKDLVPFTLPVAADGHENYLAPTAFVECEDPTVVKLAEEAVGDETDALKAAARIESYVRDKITKKNLNVGFASAAEVAKTLEGDCTEHAVLCCAIARAKGLPARVAMGLAYLPAEGDIAKQWPNGVFGYHMWTEVLVADGVWLPIDAAIGGYDATHLALAKSDMSSVSPGLDMMIALLKVLGTMTIEVIEP